MQSIALIPKCEECEAVWLPTDQERWRAYPGCDEDLDEPAELFFYCPSCASASSTYGSSAATRREAAEGQIRAIVMKPLAKRRGP